MIASTRHHVADRGMPRRTDAKFRGEMRLAAAYWRGFNDWRGIDSFRLAAADTKYVCSALAVLYIIVFLTRKFDTQSAATPDRTGHRNN